VINPEILDRTNVSDLVKEKVNFEMLISTTPYTVSEPFRKNERSRCYDFRCHPVYQRVEYPQEVYHGIHSEISRREGVWVVDYL
jgi:hypothetical protein